MTVKKSVAKPQSACGDHAETAAIGGHRNARAPDTTQVTRAFNTFGTSGAGLDPHARTHFERKFAHDFSHVRVHTDERAAHAATALDALAFTVSNHIVFGSQRYDPDSRHGLQLIGHELAHVVQQSRAGSALPDRHASLEHDAEAAASSALSGEQPVQVRGSSAVGVARAPAGTRIGRDFEGALMIDIDLPLGTQSAGRQGFEKEVREAFIGNIEENQQKWEAAHAVGSIMGVELKEGILLAPHGVNSSLQKNLESYLTQFRGVVPAGSRVQLRLTVRENPTTPGVLGSISYELHLHAPGQSESLTPIRATISVSQDIGRPTASVEVHSSTGDDAVRQNDDAFNIRKVTSQPQKTTSPLKPRSPAPATYTATYATLKRSEVPNPEVHYVRPTPAPQNQTPAPAAPSTAQTKLAETPPPAPATGTATSPPPSRATGWTQTPDGTPRLTGSQGQRVYGARPPPSEPVQLPESLTARQAKAGAVAGAVEMGMAKLDQWSKEIQDKDARSALLAARQQVIDALRNDPGVGAIVEVQFLEPEHRFEGVYWHKTTDPGAGKPTRIYNLEARQPTSRFVLIPPTREASPNNATQSEIKQASTGEEFISMYMAARGADLAGTGDLAIEMHNALIKAPVQFGVTDIKVGAVTIRLTNAARASVEPALLSLASRTVGRRVTELQGRIDDLHRRVVEKIKEFFGGPIKFTGHELDPARAHLAAAQNYLKDGKPGPASESLDSGNAQADEIWEALFEYEHGYRL